jgi:spermidine synthase
MGGRLFSFAVACASTSTIALELVLTRIFSVTMYYHFAFLAISVALLGLAAAGSAIFVFPRVFRKERALRLASLFMIGFAVSVVWSLHAATTNPVSLKDTTSNLGTLAHVYIATAAPLVCSGFAISLAIANAGDQIGKIYMFDLVGAGIGCVLMVPTIGALGAPGAVLIVGAVGGVSALLFILADRGWPKWRIVAGIAVAAVIALAFFGVTEGSERRFGIVRNPTKFLGNRKVLFERWNSFSQITVAPAGDADHLWIFIDGDAATRMWKRSAVEAKEDPRVRIPEIRVAAMVYALRPQGPAAIIGPGGGTDVLSALRAGVDKVVGIEINPLIANDVMRGEFADTSGNLYVDNPHVEIVVDEGRSYLRRSGKKFATIQATLVDTWAASSSGAFTLSENNLYTVEAFEEFMDALAPGGVMALTRWYDPSKPGELVRLISIARRALENRGVAPADIRKHVLIATDNQARATVNISRDAFSDADVAKFSELVKTASVRTLYVAGATAGNDKLLAKTLEAPDLDDFLSTLSYDATPTTDNKPFFFYHQRLGDILSSFGKSAAGQLNNVGLVVLVILLGFSLLTTILFVVVPLLLFRRGDLATDRKRKLRVIGYFGCLGLGFILVELGFMQQFVLFLGHPVYSLAVVLSGLLIASGIGAGITPILERTLGVRRAKWACVGALTVVLALYGLGLSALFGALIGLPLPGRIAIAAALVALPGLVMGTFVPNGVRTANSIAPGLVAWGWGLNGATSVVGSALAVMLSMNIGFRVVLFIGVAIYILGGLLLPTRGDTAP